MEKRMRTGERREENRKERTEEEKDQQTPSIPSLAPHTHATISLLQEGGTKRVRSSARGRSTGCWQEEEEAEIPSPAF